MSHLKVRELTYNCCCVILVNIVTVKKCLCFYNNKIINKLRIVKKVSQQQSDWLFEWAVSESVKLTLLIFARQILALIIIHQLWITFINHNELLYKVGCCCCYIFISSLNGQFWNFNEHGSSPFNYSGGWNTQHLNSEQTQNPNVLEIGILNCRPSHI